jgi:hypothetical protein
MEWFEALGYNRRIRLPRVQPQIVICLPQNHGRTIMYISDERIRLCSKNRACFDDLVGRISPAFPNRILQQKFLTLSAELPMIEA